RRSAQTAMYIVLHGLTKLLAPILSYTAEEMWQFMTHLDSDNKESVFLNNVPEYKAELEFKEVADAYNKLFAYRDDVMKALELARAEKLIGKSLDASVTIYVNDEKTSEFFKSFENELNDIFICSEVKLSADSAPTSAFSETETGIAVKVEAMKGIKCDRCWYVKNDCEDLGEEQHLCKRCMSIVKSTFPEILA
ncbi:MAG: class I tRNA ligase family protein, partial [Clostridia bacterium]|nr:class I tRNA ligase family protein [Clostridia bacterium]